MLLALAPDAQVEPLDVLAEAAGLKPVPADLSDFRRLENATPLDFYRRVTIGVAGTSMPAYESRLPADERWAVAAYASTLRHPIPRGEVPSEFRDFTTTAALSDNPAGNAPPVIAYV